MAGSGGSYDPKKVRTEVRELQSKIDSAQYEADVAHLLSTMLASANDRDVKAISTHLSSIKRAIERDADGVVDLMFGGSVAKKTYVEGISDVDALVVLNESEPGQRSPLEVRDYFIARLRERLPGTIVEADGFAVVVKYADATIDLVPVKRRSDTYLLPSEDCASWSRVRPRAFAEALSTCNRAQNGKVIPTIKLAKIVLTNLPEARRPSGYHLEALALDAFSTYHGTTTPKEMLTQLFMRAAQRVLKPIEDRTGQSRNVDEYLGASGSVERRILSESLGRIARRLTNADDARSLDQWKHILGDG